MILPLQGAALKGDAVTQGAALGYEMFFLCFATKAAKPSGPFGAYVTRAEGTFHAVKQPYTARRALHVPKALSTRRSRQPFYLTTYFFPLWM